MSNRLAVLKAGSAPIRDYPALIEAIRARMADLGLRHLHLDAKAGLADGHASKILCSVGGKGWKVLGPVSLPLILATLDCHLALVPNAEKSPVGCVMDVGELVSLLKAEEAEHV